MRPPAKFVVLAFLQARIWIEIETSNTIQFANYSPWAASSFVNMLSDQPTSSMTSTFVNNHPDRATSHPRVSSSLEPIQTAANRMARQENVAKSLDQQKNSRSRSRRRPLIWHRGRHKESVQIERRILLPVRILAALLRLLLLPLRILLLPLVILLRLVLQLLRLLLQLLRLLDPIALLFMGGQFVLLALNVARTIVMIVLRILRIIFKRHRHRKDEHDEINVITLTSQDELTTTTTTKKPKPKSKATESIMRRAISSGEIQKSSRNSEHEQRAASERLLALMEHLDDMWSERCRKSPRAEICQRELRSIDNLQLRDLLLERPLIVNQHLFEWQRQSMALGHR